MGFALFVVSRATLFCVCSLAWASPSLVYEKTSARAPACLPWRRCRSWRLFVLPPVVPRPPTPVERELHALRGCAVAMHCAPAWGLDLGTSSLFKAWVMAVTLDGPEGT